MNSETSITWQEAAYRERATPLLLYGRALGLSENEAEDVLQECFVALLQREERPAEPLHYAVRTYRNLAFGHRRSLWRRLRREWQAQRWFESTTPLDPREEAAQMALTRLPLEQREVIVLKIWHHCTFEEMGRLLEISPHTAAGRYRYGLQKLRLTLKTNRYEPSHTIGTNDGLLEWPVPEPGP